MNLLELTLPTPNENLALDEALLESAEANPNSADEVLRIWEPANPMVVLGRSSPLQKEVNQEFCSKNGIEITRRSSGGQTVVSGPGCLMYCVLLSYKKRPELRMLDQAHRFVMSAIGQQLNRAGAKVAMQGTSDLTIEGRKISGNSLRCKRNFLIYHGTLLYGLSIDLIQNCLNPPIREPEYRAKRSHADFLQLLNLDREELRKSLITAFQATKVSTEWPHQMMHELVDKKYSKQEWLFSR